MIEVLKGERHIIGPLCKSRRDDVVLWSCVEGNIGRVWVDGKDALTCAIIVVADFCFLFGNFVKKDYEELLSVLADYCKGKVIISEDKSLDSFIESKFPTSFRRYKRYEFNKELTRFNRQQLKDFALSVEPGFKVVKMNEALYYQALKDGVTADFCSYFSSPDEFLKHGIGYTVVNNSEIIAGASSYTYCEGNIEITIGTVKDYSRKGLALACASKLILECLKKGIYPRWDAANKESVALAEKLGYHFEKEYDVYSF